MNLMKIASERDFEKPQQHGTGRTYRLLHKALAAAAANAAAGTKGRVVFVCRGGSEAYLRGLVKKILKEDKNRGYVVQWFQLWPLQRDLESLRNTPHQFVLDHAVDCPEVRGAFSSLGPERILP